MDQLISLFISSFVLAAIGIIDAGSNVLLPAEVYWHKVLPNAPMPRALSDILHLDRLEIDLDTEKYTVDDNIKWGGPPHSSVKNLDTEKYTVDDNIKWGGPPHSSVKNLDTEKYTVDDNIKWGGPPHSSVKNLDTEKYTVDDNIKWGGPPHSSVKNLDTEKYTVDDNIKWGGPPHSSVKNLDTEKYTVDDNIKWGGPPHSSVKNLNTEKYTVDDNIKWGGPPHSSVKNLNTEKYTADDNIKWGGPPHSSVKKTHRSYNDTNINTSLYFLEKDLIKPGAIKNMIFTRNHVLRTNFAPLQVAKVIPFSSTKLPEILNHFSIRPDTAEAAAIKTTLDLCEMPEFEGEKKFCATSLESLVESNMLALGTRNVQALSTVVSKEGTPKQPYKVATSGLEILSGSDIVACHTLLYPFVVYYCHSIKGTKAYKIPSTGQDGTKVAAVAVCHTETSMFDPEHIAFKVLKVKPGTVPICHVFPQDNLIWISNQ